MSHKSILLLSLTVALCLLVLPGIGFQADALSAATNVWVGAWQLGPSLEGDLISCGPTDGFARITGVYYQPHERVYFLGARCESDATTGAVFYFDIETRTYGLTGATMPVPVSNYQVVSVPDDGAGNGPGFYIVGGRTGTGTQTDAVQVYYPDTNTTAEIETDPYPPDGKARSPGGVVFAGGKIYVFGGFDGIAMYADTHTYDPAAPAGSRWVNLEKPLPTPRSYIAALAVGDLIYAMGGDEYTGDLLVPLTDTLVLDLNNLEAGWQDDLMPDLPIEYGDAPAVYVDEGFIGGESGGIFIIGGNWYELGRWVHRFDIASQVWESFPELAIPDPATGRRNMAAVYVPSNDDTKGLGSGIPGIWVFGGFDGEDANTMTPTSEFFSLEENPVLLLPVVVEQVSDLGTTVTHDLNILNLSGETDSYDLSYIADVGWEVDLPANIGPVEDNMVATFSMQVTIPADIPCPLTGTFTITATSQSDPLTSDAEAVRVVAGCNVSGVVTDATTGEPIPNAKVGLQSTVEGLDFMDSDFSDSDGYYYIGELVEETYYMYASADKHQPSFYLDGWPEDAVVITFAGAPLEVDFSLVSSRLEWSPESIDAALVPGAETEQTLTLNNTGTGPLYFFLNMLDATQPDPPPAVSELPVPGLPRLDPLLLENLENASDGRADFVVVLASQADLSGAQAIMDWQTRGEYVYNQLRGHAERSQQGVRRMLQDNGVAFQPLHIINALIVHGGDQALVNRLAAREDVAQIIANRAFEIEQPQTSAEQILSPDAIEWNIQRVGANDVWSDYSVTGEGIVVAEIDSGTQWDHPALINQYRGWDGSTADHNYNWYDPYGQSPDVPSDVFGHGTHVMGTMVGDDGGGKRIGMAPGAQWISCKGGDNVSGYLLIDELLQCAEWILAPTDLQGNNPEPSLRPHVVNNSWGGGQNDYWYTGVVDAWRAAGIFPMFSNGNEGPACSTAGEPGDTWNAFSAGASDIDDQIAGFSSRGPSLITGYLKPDITAPGVNINSSLPDDTYGQYSGTSMASPHVAGAIALLWSSNPELIGQIDLSGWLLQQSAVPMTTDEGCGGDLPDAVPNNTWGYGLLDIYAAVALARTGDIIPDWLSVAPLGGEVAPGESLDVTLSFTSSLDMLGSYNATLWLVADDPYNSDVRLPVNLTVVEELFQTHFPLIFKTSTTE